MPVQGRIIREICSKIPVLPAVITTKGDAASTGGCACDPHGNPHGFPSAARKPDASRPRMPFQQPPGQGVFPGVDQRAVGARRELTANRAVHILIGISEDDGSDPAGKIHKPSSRKIPNLRPMAAGKKGRPTRRIKLFPAFRHQSRSAGDVFFDAFPGQIRRSRFFFEQLCRVVVKNRLQISGSASLTLRRLPKCPQGLDPHQGQLLVERFGGRVIPILIEPGERLPESHTPSLEVADRIVGPEQNAPGAENIKSRGERLALTHRRGVHPGIVKVPQAMEAFQGVTMRKTSSHMGQNEFAVGIPLTQTPNLPLIFGIGHGPVSHDVQHQNAPASVQNIPHPFGGELRNTAIKGHLPFGKKMINLDAGKPPGFERRRNILRLVFRTRQQERLPGFFRRTFGCNPLIHRRTIDPPGGDAKTKRPHLPSRQPSLKPLPQGLRSKHGILIDKLRAMGF